MRLGRRLVLLTAVTALLGGPVVGTASSASAAGAVSADQGWVRCADLSPGTPEDVYLYPFGNPSHPTMLMHQGYGSVSEYMPVSAGQYTLAMRPPGAPASSPPTVSTSFMVSAGSNYTVASIGTASSRRLKVLDDQMAAAAGSKALVRVIQASVKQPQVTVSVGSDVLARELGFGSASSYQSVRPGSPTVTFSAPGGHAAMPVTLTAGSVHTLVVLDGSSGLTIDNLTDAAGSKDSPRGGAATGFGGTAPRGRAGADSVAGHAGGRGAAGSGRDRGPAQVASYGRRGSGGRGCGCCSDSGGARVGQVPRPVLVSCRPVCWADPDRADAGGCSRPTRGYLQKPAWPRRVYVAQAPGLSRSKIVNGSGWR